MTPAEDDWVVPSHLLELGQKALAAVAISVARGAPLVKCQLLASGFYEVLRRELRQSSSSGFAARSLLVAAARQCGRAATPSISPDTMLAELGAAIAMLRPGGHSIESRHRRLPPVLRVIEGGLSRFQG
jgi:hypothetical protein